MPYKFHRPFNRNTIIIENDRGEREKWDVEMLRFAVASSGLPAPVRDMAREALRHYGLLEETQEPEVIPSDTIVTIQGVKVYQDIISRVFFIKWKGARLFGTLTDLERKIKRSIGL